MADSNSNRPPSAPQSRLTSGEQLALRIRAAEMASTVLEVGKTADPLHNRLCLVAIARALKEMDEALKEYAE